MKDTGLKAEQKLLITFVEDHALNTKLHKTSLQNIKLFQNADCTNMGETEHMLPGTEYIQRHNGVAKFIYRNICENKTIEISRMQQPEAVTGNVKIL